MEEKVVKVENLNSYYGKKSVLKDVSFSMNRGECLGILGPNGAGKTTLIRNLLGVIPNYWGQIQVFGEKPKPSEKEIYKKIGYLPEDASVYMNMSLSAYLKFFAELRGCKNHRKAVDDVISLMQLEEVQQDKLKTFSKGMIQKAKVASVIMHEPELLILDEPTDGLDIETTCNMVEILNQYRKSGNSIIICSHLPHIIEQLCTSILLISKGKIKFHGNIEEFVSNNYDEKGSQMKLGTQVSNQKIEDAYKYYINLD